MNRIESLGGRWSGRSKMGQIGVMEITAGGYFSALGQGWTLRCLVGVGVRRGKCVIAQGQNATCTMPSDLR